MMSPVTTTTLNPFRFLEKGEEEAAASKSNPNLQPKEIATSSDQSQMGKESGATTRNVTQLLTKPSAVKKVARPSIMVQRPDFDEYGEKIHSDYVDPQYVRIQAVSGTLLFSQATVSEFNTVMVQTGYGKMVSSNYPISDLALAMFIQYKRHTDEEDGGVLDVVHMGKNPSGEDIFTSIDNRRLLIAKKIGRIDRTYGIWVRVHKFNDELSPALQRRFKGKAKDINIPTWGAAVLHRTGGELGFAKWARIAREAPQAIPLNLVGLNFSPIHKDDRTTILGKQKKGVIDI